MPLNLRPSSQVGARRRRGKPWTQSSHQRSGISVDGSLVQGQIIADLQTQTLNINGSTNTIKNYSNLYAGFFSSAPYVLIGDKGNNRLSGQGLGNDVLEGGGGQDTLLGGVGGDTFVFAKMTDSSPSAPDLITNLHTGDLIDLHLIDANPSLPGRQHFHLHGAEPSGGAILVHYDASQEVKDVELFLNGDTTPDGLIQLSGHHLLTPADFVY